MRQTKHKVTIQPGNSRVGCKTRPSSITISDRLKRDTRKVQKKRKEKRKRRRRKKMGGRRGNQFDIYIYIYTVVIKSICILINTIYILIILSFVSYLIFLCEEFR